jgi:hypothetical protein
MADGPRHQPAAAISERRHVKTRYGITARLAAALVLATLTLTGCDNTGNRPGADAATGDAAAPSTQDTTAAACPVDADILSQTIGIAMTQTAAAPCGFVAASPEPGQVIEIYYTAIDAMVFDGSEGEIVVGVGDAARWDTQMAGSLLVKTGSRHFSVQAVAMGDLPEPLHAKNLAITVARLILNG